MTEGKSRFKLVVYAILIVILFFALIRIFAYGSGMFFNLELLGFIVLLLLSIIGFIGYVSSWGERVLFFVFLFYIANLVLLWYFQGSLYVVLLFLSLVGFLMSLPKKAASCSCNKKKQECAVKEEPEPHSMVFDEPKKEAAEKKTEKKVTAKHSPGKYVASKSSNVYHEPKCDWAKRINKNRQVWFAKKEDAWEKGYKAHSCVE